MNIGSLIKRNAQYRPDHLAVVFEDQRFSYAQFNRRTNRLANAMLALGVSHGQRVATFLPNCLELLEIYWAAAKLGVVVVPLSPMLLEAGLSSLLGDSEAVILFTNNALRAVADNVKRNLAPQLDGRCVLVDGNADGYLNYDALTEAASEDEPPPVEIRPDDVYNIMYTSGTTGLPKGIVLTHQIRANYGALLSSSFRMTPESVVLHTGSIVFNGAFATMLSCFYLGATYVLHRQFDVEALIETVQREKVTHTMMVPSQIIAMMASPKFNQAAMQSMEMILSLGAPLHQESKDQLNRDLPGRFYELYGLTEGFLTILDREDAIRKQGSVGVPPPFSELRIVRENGAPAEPREIGEIVGRSPFQMPGYFKRPDLTAAAIKDGWLHSGDLGYVDEDGFLYLVDRKKDMIDSGGVKVYPRDVEEVIMHHPAVLEVAVFGIPHEKWGETPIATVVLKQAGSISAAELKEWINANVSARFQRVHEVVLMEEFPRSAAGKILKRELRDPYWADHGRKI
jgi:acyl-CoA synthetase (AMP-forming)/AMP-acid ligase II